jgi:hypothetical protein
LDMHHMASFLYQMTRKTCISETQTVKCSRDYALDKPTIKRMILLWKASK